MTDARIWSVNQFNGAGKTSLTWVHIAHGLKDDTDAGIKLKEIELEKEQARSYIESQLEPLLYTAAQVVGMTYTNNTSGNCVLCQTFGDISDSWSQDNSEENQKRLAYVLYHYIGRLYTTVHSGRNHCDTTEEQYMKDNAISYFDSHKLESNKPGRKKSSCLKQLYNRVLTDKRCYILRKGCIKHGTKVHRRSIKPGDDLVESRKKGDSEFIVTEHSSVVRHGLCIDGADITYRASPVRYCCGDMNV